MVLGKEHVFVNYLVNVVPDQSFSDGSDVILVGKIGQDTLWGANRVIIHSFAIIQLDQEKAVLIDPKSHLVVSTMTEDHITERTKLRILF